MKKIFSFIVAALFCASMFAETYTVAGDREILGSHWDITDETNDLTINGTQCTLVKEGVTLAPWTYQLKVVQDHAWDNSWPGDNASLTISEKGVYTVTVTFDIDTKAVTIAADKTADVAVDIRVIMLHGNFSGEWANTDRFEIANDNATASLQMKVTKGDYEFGMRVGASDNWTATGKTYKRAGIEEGTGNMRLNADVTGLYTFTYNYNDNTLSVEFPDLAEVDDGYYLIGLNGWYISELRASDQFSLVSGSQYKLTGVNLELNDEFKVVKIENKYDVEWYGAGEGNNNYKVTENYVGTKDIYFNTTRQNDWNGYVYVKPNSTVDIENTKEGAKAVKVLRNGMLFIEKNGKTYNLLGTIVR